MTISTLSEAVILSFHEKYIPEPNSGCWLWTAAGHPNGYGCIGVGYPKTEVAHRVSWKIAHGAIPGGLYVLHKCDVRCCVNPDHLFLGTSQDNMDDMYSKGRGNKAHGVGQWAAKLNDDKVRWIRANVGTGLSTYAMAEIFGVAAATIQCVINRKTWRHVE